MRKPRARREPGAVAYVAPTNAGTSAGGSTAILREQKGGTEMTDGMNAWFP